MRLTITFASLAGSLVLALIPSDAQFRASRFDGATATKFDTPKIIEQMADCVARVAEKNAVRWMDTVPGSKQDDSMHALLNGTMENCMSSEKLVVGSRELVLEPSRIRRATGLALVRANKSLLPASLPSNLPEEPWYRSRRERDEGYDGFALGVHKFGNCVVKADWTNSKALTMTKAGSKEEKQLIKVLTPVLAPCLNVGVKLEIDKRLMRDVIGDALYHIALEPILLKKFKIESVGNVGGSF